MRIKSSFFLLPLLFASQALRAQEDKLHILTQESYLQIVRSFHPLVRAARLDVASARANVMRSKGAFDPVLSAGYRAKNLDGKEYYTYFTPAVTIPTWYGVELKAGVEDARGLYLNPETTPGAVNYVGAKVVLNNILFDARRTGLEQARVLVQQSQAEQTLALNDLYYQSLSAYWNWWLSWAQGQMWKDAQQVAAERLNFVQQEYEAGARAAIDTTEALTQIQTLEAQMLSADLALQNSGLTLNTYLWHENSTLVPWQTDWQPVRPALRDLPPLSFFLEQLEAHPKIRSARAKTEFLSLDQRLKNQYLLPKMGVSGSLLNKGWNFFPKEISGNTISGNYKLEADLSLPLFLREARGSRQMARIKTQQAGLAQDLAYVELETKIKSAYNEALNLSRQQALWEASLLANERLLQGENIRFENGESTLFLVNSRQAKLLETQQKVLEIYAKRGKAEASLYWAAGILVP